MDWSALGKECLHGAITNVLQMAAFIIPIMVFIEILRDLNVLDLLSRPVAPFLRLYRLPKDACLPLLAGLFFGIAFGAGVILQTVREGHLTLRDLYIIHIFLVICHGFIDDTILFVAIGANGFLILVPRVLLAVGICYIISRLYKPADRLNTTRHLKTMQR
ncbi:MAG: nucleoside recognition protein [Peptococcaceae bacterium]|nr:nucleoside recognition protein [Peptococcaceae bacterium]